MKWERDKQLHALGGAVISVAVGFAFIVRTDFPILLCIALGTMVGGFVGWAKEYWYDAKRQDRHMVDKNDFIATALGAALGSVVLLVLNHVIKG